MKKLFLILAIGSLSYCAEAQDSSNSNMKDTSMAGMGHVKKDCVMMMKGKMMVMKNGMKMMMTDPVMLTNGATVMKDGTVKMADGSTKMLKEGQYVDMDGKMGMMMKKKDM